MKKALLFFLISIQGFLHAQINQVWHTDRPLSYSFNDSYMRIVNNNIYTHTTLFEGGSWQSAQSITTDGQENWYMEHEQFNACNNCGNAGVESVAIASNGDAYGVGFQPAFPFGGRYVYKTDSAGNLIYAEELFTSTFSGEFNDVKLSNDETVLYVTGDMYVAAYNTLVPHLFKINASTGVVISEVITAPIGWTGVKKIAVGAGDNIYMNTSDVDTLRFSSWDPNLNLRWFEPIPIVGYQGSGQVQTLFYPNGDVLFATYLNNYNVNQDQRIHLARFSEGGELIWQTTHILEEQDVYGYLYRDIVLDNSENVFIYLVKSKFVGGGGGGFAGDQLGGSGGSSQIRPAIYKFNSIGAYQWNYVYEGSSGVEFSSEYPARIIVDENGFVIASSFGNSSGYGGVSIFIINPQGLLETSLFQNGTLYSAINGMVYEGNRTFYTHGIGASDSSFTANRWTLARYHYDYTTGLQLIPNSDFTIYPNPAGSNTAVTLAGIKPNEVVELRDMQGRLIMSALSAEKHETSMNLSGVAAGIYLVKAGRICKKLILQ